MKPILTEKLNLNQINSRFGLLPEDDILNYLERYDNGVEIMDDNYEFTGYHFSSGITFIVLFTHDAWKVYFSFKKSGVSDFLKIYKLDEKYVNKNKIKNAKQKFKNKNIEIYRIITKNVYVVDDEADFLEGREREREREVNEPKYDPYDDIPYLGLRDDEQETGHWNID